MMNGKRKHITHMGEMTMAWGKRGNKSGTVVNKNTGKRVSRTKRVVDKRTGKRYVNKR